MQLSEDSIARIQFNLDPYITGINERNILMTE
jgi:hypothetical protein